MVVGTARGNALAEIEAVAAEVEGIVTALCIPLKEVELSRADIETGDMLAMSAKLATAAHYIVKTNTVLRSVEVRLAVTDAFFDQEMDRAITGGSGKGTLTAQRAAALEESPQLQELASVKNSLEASRIALQSVMKSLDILWRTTNRILSVRSTEPSD